MTDPVLPATAAAESMVPKDYQEDPRAKAAFDAAFADFNKKQGRSKVPTCNIARDTQVEPYRLWWEVQAWGGVDKVRTLLLVPVAVMLPHAPSTVTSSTGDAAAPSLQTG